MATSQHDADRTIVEILRDGGMDYPTAVALLEEHITREDRWALCAALELWEAGEKVRVDRISELIENVERARDDFRASQDA